MKDFGNRKFKAKKYKEAREHFEKVIHTIHADFYGDKLDKF